MPTHMPGRCGIINTDVDKNLGAMKNDQYKNAWGIWHRV